MPGDFFESRPARSLFLGLAFALGAVAASALLAHLRARMVDRALDDDPTYLGWVASVLNKDRRVRDAPKQTIH